MFTFLAALADAPLHAEDPEVASDPRFISNDRIKIGVDISSGGAVFWFGEMPDGPNLLNHADRGRFIQQSYYGNPDGSSWNGKPWVWNPVQGGHYKGKPAEILNCEVTDTSIHVEGIPMNWAGGELLRDCRMEQWITLDGDTATIRFRFEYKGGRRHKPRHQELPAVFVDAALKTLVRYGGDTPWKGRDLTREIPGWPNQTRDCPEQWAAYVGADNRGVGVFFPGTTRITCYRFKGPSGPDGGGCSYFAPIQTLAITPGFIHDYRIHLTIGTADEIRRRFAAMRELD